LGRNYILCGQYTEIYFPSRNVRFISLNDGVDSLHSNNDIAPFKNILNDMYAKDMSVKIKSALHAKARKGEFLGSVPPYGYARDPENRHRLVINPDAAKTVLRIFELAVAGHGIKRTVKMLNDDGVLAQADYSAYLKHNLADGEYKPRYKWLPWAISQILHNEAYLGHMVQCRKKSQSYRTKKIVWNDKEDWIIARDVHEPIVSQELFDRAKKAIAGRTRVIEKRGEPHLFSGIIFCKECGRRMSHHARETQKDFFSCRKYHTEGLSGCTSHFIPVDDVSEIVLQSIQTHVKLLQEDEDAALQRLLEKKNTDEKMRLSTASQELVQQKKRQLEIEMRIKKVYEDNVSGKLPDDLFSTFLRDYETEKVALRDSIKNLEDTIHDIESNRTDVAQFIKLIKGYAGITELTRPALLALVDKVTISEPRDSRGKRGHHDRERTINIHYRFVGAL